MTHQLKSWPNEFEAVLDGSKTHEFRRNDRNFKTGDLLDLHEWDPVANNHTTRTVIVQVTYINHGMQFGIPRGYCVMSIAKVE